MMPGQNLQGQNKKGYFETCLVVQWIRIHLPMQGIWIDNWSGKLPQTTEQLSLCATNTEPAPQNPRAATTETILLKTTEAHAPRACGLQQEKPPQQGAQAQQLDSSLCFPQLEKSCVQQRRLSPIKKINKLYFSKRQAGHCEVMNEWTPQQE